MKRSGLRLRLCALTGMAFFLVCGLQAGQEDLPPQSPYDPLIEQVALKYRVDPPLVHSIIRAESNYDPWAVSPKGALGLMQLMPETAIQYGVRNVFDPRQNIEGGVRYLVDLIKLFDGDTKRVLAAYNAGQEAIRRYGGIPPYPETREYIKKVMTQYPKEKIISRTKIYKYRDEQGRVVFTNIRALWEKYKKKSNQPPP